MKTKNKQTKKKKSKIYMNKAKLIISGIVLLCGTILCLMLFEFKTVKGKELGVLETWGQGVVDKVLQPKNYYLFPGFTQEIYTYDASSQVFVMNDKPDHEEPGNGRRKDAYLVQSQEGQDLTISMNLRWRINPSKLIDIHKTVGKDIEEKIIRPVLMRVVKDEATKMRAIEAYSGEGLVRLQSNIQLALQGSGEGAELSQRGIIVENFVIEHIALDPKYIEEIKGKQIATQRQLRGVEEQRAAEVDALVAKSKAQADLNKAVVEAQRDKEVMVLAAQAQNEKAILAAKAEQQKRILEAEGQRDADIAKSKGVLALGEAEATAQKLKLQAYAVPGAESFVKIEVSKNMAQAYQGIKGYLPADLKINILSDSFDKALDVGTGNPVVLKK